MMLDKIKTWWNNLPLKWHGIYLKKITTWLMLGFIILLGFMFTQEAKADEITMELAPVLFVAGDRYDGALLIFEDRWNEKYALGIGLTTKWNCRNVCPLGDGPRNQFIYAQRIVQYKKFEIGIGMSYWHKQSPAWNSNTPFSLHLGWNFNKHLNLKWRHFSTGGTSGRNDGLNLLTIGWRF